MASISENTTISELYNQFGDMTLKKLVRELKRNGFDYDDDKDMGKIEKFFRKIKESALEVDRLAMDLTKHWQKVDAAASKYARTIATTKAGMDALRASAVDNARQRLLGFEFGMDAEDLIIAQTDYAKKLGRNIKIGESDQRNLAAIKSVYGEFTDINEFFNDFDKFGLSISSAGEHMGKLYADASKTGISLEAYAKNVQQGLAMAQTYNFKNGLRGMEAMARRAAAIRMDMSQVSAFADKFSTVEDALQNAAKLQVLGGPFAGGADPIGLLHDSLSSVEEIEKRMENFTEGLATFNKKTGEVEISDFNRLRLKQFAEVTGQDFQKVMEVTRRQGMRGEIEAQMMRSKNYATMDEDLKELIKNSATIQNGKAGVTIDGDFKTLDEITAKDRNTLIAQSRTDSENIQSIAKDVRSLLDLRSNITKQYNTQAAWLEGPIGQGVKGLTQTFTELGKTALFILGTVRVFGMLGEGMLHGRRIANLWKRGGGAGGSGGFSSSSVFGKKTASTATGSTGKRIFGNIFKKKAVSSVAKEGVEQAAIKGAGSRIAKGGLGRTITRLGIKTGGRVGGKVAAGLVKGVAKGGLIGVLGAAGDIATNMLVDSGKIKKGGTAHAAMKVGSSALEWAALGSMIAPGIGTAVGAAVGTAIGAFQIRHTRREMMVDNQLKSLGIERQGKYSTKKLSQIDEALQTGKMSNSLRKNLLRKGDTEIVNKIKEVEAKKKEEKEAAKDKKIERLGKLFGIAKNTLGTARFTVTNAYFDGVSAPGQGGLLGGMLQMPFKRGLFGLSGLELAKRGLDKVKVLRGKKEDGNSPELTKLGDIVKKKEATDEKKLSGTNGPIEINVNGTIKLETGNGQSIDLMAEIKKDPTLVRQLAEMIFKSKEYETLGTNRTSGRIMND